MRKFLMIFILTSILNTIQAQDSYQAAEIIQMIDQGKSINIDGATIYGDLDFTTIEKKYKGGKYGVRGGVAKEYFTRVEVRVQFKNCNFEGKIISRTEYWVGKVKKENFASFNSDMSFVGCNFNDQVDFEDTRFKGQLLLEQCNFFKGLKFKHVHFEQAPRMTQTNINGRFVNEHTNWKSDKSALERPKPIAKDLVEVTFKNPSFRSVQIQFGSEKWTLSPHGESSLQRKAGTKIYILDKTEGKRLALTLDQSMNGREYNISKL